MKNLFGIVVVVTIQSVFHLEIYRIEKKINF